eukprot:Phypoly_transcript_20616.p1 GENE.Phypoly_transcript_20616~~Phypoly_transcript_20616.p1  ORF type:complete len:152 (+),score=17.23 Phypoly_transcript_20616:168-623(+)
MRSVALLVVLLACVVSSYGQAKFVECNNFKGIFTYNSYSFGGATPSNFISLQINGTLTDSIVTGNINIRLTNSDTGALANEIQGINICDAGAKGHNICNLPANTPLIIEAQAYWSPYYPHGAYDLSVVAYGYFQDSTTQQPVTCGDLTFNF